MEAITRKGSLSRAREISPVRESVPADELALIGEGAAALRCWPWSFGTGFGREAFGMECVLPLTAPPSAPAGRRWLEWAVGELRRDGKPLPARAQALLREALHPCGELRRDGLPSYRHSGPTPAEESAGRGTLSAAPGAAGEDYGYNTGRTVLRHPYEYESRPIEGLDGATFTASRWRKSSGSIFGREFQRDGAPLRRLLAAVAYDLLDQPAHEVGALLLGHRPLASEHDQTDSRAWRAAARYWGEGRAMLAQLGCWPWAHAPGGRGKLPRGENWRDDSTYREPLRRWVLAD